MKRQLDNLYIIVINSDTECSIMVEGQSLSDNFSCDLFDKSEAWIFMRYVGKLKLYTIKNGKSYYKSNEHFVNAVGQWLTDKQITWTSFNEGNEIVFKLIEREYT